MNSRNFANSFVIFVLSLVMGCVGHGPAEIHYGQDQCDYCNMNIVDRSFGTQLMTSKKKVFKFDSIECLAAYAQSRTEELIQESSVWLTDFANPGIFVRLDSSTIVVSETQNSPMGVGLIGFGSLSAAQNFVDENGGQILNWMGTCQLVANRWNL